MQVAPPLQEIRSWRARAGEVTGAGIDEAELLDQVRALEEVKAAAAAAQARLTARLYAVRASREAAEGVPARSGAPAWGPRSRWPDGSPRTRATAISGSRWR